MLLYSCRALYSRTARSSTPRRIKKNKFKLKDFVYGEKKDSIPQTKKCPFEGKTDWTMPIEDKSTIYRFLMSNDSTPRLRALLSAVSLENFSDHPFKYQIPLPEPQYAGSEQNGTTSSSPCSSYKHEERVFTERKASTLVDSRPNAPQPLSMACPWIRRLGQISKDNPIHPISLIDEMVGKGDISVSYSHIYYALLASIRLKDPDAAIALYKKCTELQIGQSLWLYSLVLEAHIKASRLSDALQMYCHLRVNDMVPPPAILNSLLSALIKKAAVKTAWSIFYEAKSKFTLPMYTYSLMIDLCAKIVRDMESESIIPSNHVLESLLHACASKKEFQEQAFAIIKRIYDSGRPLHLNLCNFMLQAHAINCDLEAFYKVWSVLIGVDKTGNWDRPNIYSFAAMFRLLANIPISKRDAKRKKISFHYDLLPTDIVKQATDVWNLLSLKYSYIKMEPFILNHYLSILATHGQKAEIEKFFHNQFAIMNIAHDKYTYQHMFLFYMRTGDFASASKLKFKVDDFNMITRKAWHYLIDTAANAKQLDTAVSYIDQMDKAKIDPPSLKAIQHLYLSVVNAERWDLRSKLNALCKRPQDVDSFKGGKREIWSIRNDAINTLLDFAYGRPGGECNVRGIYDNIRSNITILPSDQDSLNADIDSEKIPGFSKLMDKKSHPNAPLPTKKRITRNYQARKKRAPKFQT